MARQEPASLIGTDVRFLGEFARYSLGTPGTWHVERRTFTLSEAQREHHVRVVDFRQVPNRAEILQQIREDTGS